MNTYNEQASYERIPFPLFLPFHLRSAERGGANLSKDYEKHKK